MIRQGSSYSDQSITSTHVLNRAFKSKGYYIFNAVSLLPISAFSIWETELKEGYKIIVTCSSKWTLPRSHYIYCNDYKKIMMLVL